jgi:hypothetical protein
MLDHQRRDRWDLNHLMPQWLWIISLEQGAAAMARLRVMLDDLVNPLDRQQLRPGSWMARLAATAFTPLWWLNPRPSLEGVLEE